MSIVGNISVDFNLTDTRTIGLGVMRYNPRFNQTFNYTDGTGDSQGNIVYGVVRTLTGGTDTVDLAGVLSDAFGGTITDVRVKALLIYNPAGNGALTVGGGSDPAVTLVNGTIPVRPNGLFLLATTDATGHAITAGTGDILQVTGTSAQTYTLAFLAANA